MDENKLARYHKLAEKSDLNDASLAAYLENSAAQSGPGRAKVAPYAGISSLLRAPIAEGLGDVDIGLIGVPYDLGVTNRPGARFGPQQVRQMSVLAAGPKNHATGIIPGALAKYADLGDVTLDHVYDIEQANQEMFAHFQRFVTAGIIPLSVGGDHSISYPILKAIGENTPVGLVHIDAHADTGGPLNGSRFHHGGPFRNAVLDGVLDPERCIQIGIRGRAEPHWDFSYDTGMRVIHIEEYYSLGHEAVMAEIKRVVGEGPTYLSFDVDSIDPAFTPGTGTPEVGGFLPREVQAIIRGLDNVDLIGGDVVEVAPPYDPSGNTALVGATMAWEILCVLAQAFARRSAK